MYEAYLFCDDSLKLKIKILISPYLNPFHITQKSIKNFFCIKTYYIFDALKNFFFI